MKINLQEINFLKISLLISLIGILLLLLLSNILEPKLTNIEKINYKFIDKKVKVQGEIFNIKTYEDSDFQVISIKDETGKVDITSPLINVSLNQEIIVIGTVKEYKEYLQVQADKIILR
mgnify:CR=1 FL=1